MPDEVRNRLIARLKQIESKHKGFADEAGMGYLEEEIRLAKQFGIDVALLREFKRSTDTYQGSGFSPDDLDDMSDDDDGFYQNSQFAKRIGVPSRNANEQVFGAR